MNIGSREHPLRATFQAVSARLAADLQETRAILHNLTAGEAREDATIKALRPYIPQRFGLTGGEVTNLAGDRSKQQDVLIYDSARGAPFTSVGRVRVLPIEVVYGTLQVKTSLSPSEVRGAVENVASMKTLVSDDPREFMQIVGAGLEAGETTAKPWGGIIAFEGGADADKVARAFHKANARCSPEDRCHALVVPGRFVVAAAHFGPGSPRGRVFTYEELNGTVLIEAGADSMLRFYLLMLAHLDDYLPPKFNPLAYDRAVGTDGAVYGYPPAGWTPPGT